MNAERIGPDIPKATLILNILLLLFIYAFYYLDMSHPKFNFNFSFEESIIIEVHGQKIENGKEVNFIRPLNLSDSIVYVDMWRSHWCSYYNDRAWLYTYRVNEMFQRLRQFGVPIITISPPAEHFYKDLVQRKRARQLINAGSLPLFKEYTASQYKDHPKYIPKFKDDCVNDEQTDRKIGTDGRLTKRISIAEEDIIVCNFQEGAKAIAGSGKRTVIFFGQHTNMCIMNVMLYCNKMGLDVLFVRDLVDTCWVYQLEKSYAKTHTIGNNITNTFVESNYAQSVLSYDLIHSMHKAEPIVSPHYEFFMDTAWMWKHLW